MQLTAQLPQSHGEPALPNESIESQLADERELVERAKNDPESLAKLYRHHQPRISRYILRRVGNQHDAEDLTANVFMSMVKSLSRYRQAESPFVAWLYMIATNEIHAWMRKRKLRRFIGLTDTLISPTNTNTNDEGEALRVALAELPFRYQTTIALFYLEELSIDEISQITKTAPGTVKSRLARGRELLRRRLSLPRINPKEVSE